MLLKDGDPIENLQDSLYFWSGGSMTPLELGRLMQQRGLVWDREFQDSHDKSLTEELSSLEQKPAARKAAKPSGLRPD